VPTPTLDEGAARALLACLADVAAGRPTSTDASLAGDPALAAWLSRHDLAPLGRAAFARRAPDLAASLAREALGAAAANMAHFETLARIERRLAAERIDLVLLKGAAIAGAAYADPSFRPMTDIDLWVRDDDMPRAEAALTDLGLRRYPGRTTRPEALQRRSGGELVFRSGDGRHGVVELHFSPFPGWWIQRTARPDLEGLWRRSTPMGPLRHARRLESEDAILQTAFHVVVNQFGQAPLRGLMDLAVLARRQPIDWEVVADRARSWRLAHAVWIALDAADRLIGLPGCGAALGRLAPSRTRRLLLGVLFEPSLLLAGRDLTAPARRHPFMLALVDRVRDGARLAGRTVWPERWWIEARHGPRTGRARHVLALLRRGEV
jgi:hypothetical protein